MSGMTAGGRVGRFNDRLATGITNTVSTMWCAYAFACLALVSLPAAIAAGTAPLIAWIAQTFLQLVLLSIIMVGQKLQATRTDDLAVKAGELAEKHEHTHRLIAELHAHHVPTEGPTP